jgi:hypothetical protein
MKADDVEALQGLVPLGNGVTKENNGGGAIFIL